jgi:hypothetical protein
MPVKISVDEVKNLTIAKYVAPWSLEDFYQSFPEKITRDRLADLTGAGSLEWIDASVLRKIGEYSERYDAQRPGGRTAFVASEDMAQILIRLFRAIIEGEQERSITVRVFTNFDAAMEWLSSDNNA